MQSNGVLSHAKKKKRPRQEVHRPATRQAGGIGTGKEESRAVRVAVAVAVVEGAEDFAALAEAVIARAMAVILPLPLLLLLVAQRLPAPGTRRFLRRQLRKALLLRAMAGAMVLQQAHLPKGGVTRLL